MSTLAPVSSYIWRQFDNLGKMASRAWVYVYSADGTVLVDLFADEVGTPAANPIQLDGSGKAFFFGVPGAYTVTIRKGPNPGGEVIESRSPVYLFGFASSSGAGSLATCKTYAEVRALQADFDAVLVCGRASEGDGGEGLFFKAPAGVDNDGTVLISTTSSVYQRQYLGGIDPRWFGVVYGSTSDQSAPYLAAEAVGHVIGSGTVYLGSDTKITGSREFVAGGFTGPSGVKLTVDGKLTGGCEGMFGSGLTVELMEGVAPALYTSWFSDGVGQYSGCTDYSYDLVFDKSEAAPVVSIPANLRLSPKAVYTLSEPGRLTVQSLDYSGLDQWVRYASTSDVGPVDLNGTPARPEWFGAVVGPSTFIDNRIPGKAAFLSGSILLRGGEFYGFGDTGVSFAIPRTLTIASDSSERPIVNLRNQISVTGDMIVSGVDMMDDANITVSGEFITQSATIGGFLPVQTGLAGPATMGAYLPQSYQIADSQGYVRTSADLSSWSSSHPASTAIKGQTTNGAVRVIVATTNQIYASGNGGASWVNVTASHPVNGIKFAHGRYLIVCTDGYILWTADPLNGSWNVVNTGANTQLNDVTWDPANSRYIAVGNGAKIVYSGDLSSWSLASAPIGVTGNLMCVTANAHCQIIGGALNGAYLRATNGISWYQYFLPVAASAYVAESTDGTVCLAGGQFIFKSVNSGISFSFIHDAGWAITCGARNSDGTAWAFGSGTDLVTSGDLTDAKLVGSGFANQINSVGVLDPVYLISDGTSLAYSRDGRTFAAGAAVTGPKAIKLLNGTLWILAASGKLYTTGDGLNLREIPTGVSFDLSDIDYYATSGRYVLVGNSPSYLWILDPAIWGASPAWNTVTGASGTTARRVMYASGLSKWMVMRSGYAETISEPPGASADTMPNPSNGMIRTATAWIRYGAGGAVARSTDGINYTPVTSGTTSELLDGAWSGAAIVIGGANGALIRSTDDGLTWTTVSVTSNQINRVIYFHPSFFAQAEFWIVTNNHSAYRCPSNFGDTWSNAITTISGTASGDWMDVWVSEHQARVYICGTGGFLASSANGSAWTVREIYWGISGTGPFGGGPTCDLYCGKGDHVFGSHGVWVSINSPDNPSQAWTGYFGSITLRRLEKNTDVALDTSGAAYLMDPDYDFPHALHQCATPGDLASSARSLCWDFVGSKLYAVDGITYVTEKADGFKHWKKHSASAIPFRDVAYSGGAFRAVGNSTAPYFFDWTSANGLVWMWNGVENDGSEYFSVPWIAATSKAFPWIQSVRVYFPCAAGVFFADASGAYAGPSVAGPAIAAASAQATDSAIKSASVTVTGGMQSIRSTLWTASKLAVSDSTVVAAKGCELTSVVRSSVSLAGTATLSGAVSESAISKTDVLDPSRAVALSTSVDGLRIVNSDIDANGVLASGTSDGLKLYLSNCTDSHGWDYCLTPNLAIYLDNCGTVPKNSTVYAVDGMRQDDTVSVYGGDTLSAIPGWNGDGFSIVDGKIQMSADTVLGSVYSNRTIRFSLENTALKLLAALGGRIRLDIEYPAGYAPKATSKPSVALVRPHFLGLDYDHQMMLEPLHNTWDRNTRAAFGSVTPVPSSSLAAKTTAWANVWAGLQSVIPDGLAQYFADEYHDAEQTQGVIPYGIFNGVARNNWVVIYDAGAGGLMPSGTKLTIHVYNAIPKTSQQAAQWWNDPFAGVDSVSNVEVAPLGLVSARDGLVEVQRVKRASSSIATDNNYLSYVDGAHTTDSFVLPNTAKWPTNHGPLFPGLDSSTQPVKIDVIGLSLPTWQTLPPGTFRIDHELIGPDGWTKNYRPQTKDA